MEKDEYRKIAYNEVAMVITVMFSVRHTYRKRLFCYHQHWSAGVSNLKWTAFYCERPSLTPCLLVFLLNHLEGVRWDFPTCTQHVQQHQEQTEIEQFKSTLKGGRVWRGY